jgi:hypothetical protein
MCCGGRRLGQAPHHLHADVRQREVVCEHCVAGACMQPSMGWGSRGLGDLHAACRHLLALAAPCLGQQSDRMTWESLPVLRLARLVYQCPRVSRVVLAGMPSDE